MPMVLVCHGLWCPSRLWSSNFSCVCHVCASVTSVIQQLFMCLSRLWGGAGSWVQISTLKLQHFLSVRVSQKFLSDLIRSDAFPIITNIHQYVCKIVSVLVRSYMIMTFLLSESSFWLKCCYSEQTWKMFCYNDAYLMYENVGMILIFIKSCFLLIYS